VRQSGAAARRGRRGAMSLRGGFRSAMGYIYINMNETHNIDIIDRY